MGYEEYKEILVKGLEMRLNQTKEFFDKLRQKTIHVRDETRKITAEIVQKIWSSPKHEVEVKEIEEQYSQKQYSPEDIALAIALTEDTQYARRYKVDGKWYLGLGSVAERDLTRLGNLCSGRAAYRG